MRMPSSAWVCTPVLRTVEDMNIRRISISVLAIAALGLAACGGATTTEQGDALTPAVPAATPEAATGDPTEQTPTETMDESPTAETSVEEPATEPAPESPAPTEDLAEVPAAPAGLPEIEQAIAAAEAEAGGVAFAIDDEDGDDAWEIDVLLADGTTTEIEVERQNFTVVDVDPDDDRADITTMPGTTLLEAINAALAHTPGTLDDAELDDEDGRIVWKVEIDGTASGDDVELYLDSETLEVIKIDD